MQGFYSWLSAAALSAGRTFPGCGFFLCLLLGSRSGQAQRPAELSITGGATLAQPLIRNHLPATFHTTANFNTGTTLRLLLPLTRRLGLGAEQRLGGLNEPVSFSLSHSLYSVDITETTLLQLGLSLRLLDVWTPGPRWGLDVALTGSYGWLARGGSRRYEGPLQYNGPQPALPTRTMPLVRIRQTDRRGTPMAGAEALLRYEWGTRHCLLLVAGYQRGLRLSTEIRSTQVDYVDENGGVRQGSFVVSSRASYAAVQLGYGLQLGRQLASPRRNPTPRYSQDADETAPDAGSTLD